MLTVRPLYCPAAGVPSTAQASRMRGRRYAAANHLQHVSASTAQSLLPAKGRRGARVAVTYDPGRSRAGSRCLRERMFWKLGGGES
jgi:hypothetical protein